MIRTSGIYDIPESDRDHTLHTPHTGSTRNPRAADLIFVLTFDLSSFCFSQVCGLVPSHLRCYPQFIPNHNLPDVRSDLDFP